MSTEHPRKQVRKAQQKGKQQSLFEPGREGFKDLQWFGYALIFVVFGIAASIPASGFQGFLDPNGSSLPLFLSRLVLFGVLLVWAALWIVATRRELAIWVDWLEDVPQPQRADAAVLLTALYIGLSLAFVGRILLITAFFSVGLMSTIWVQRLWNWQFSVAVAATKRNHLPSSMIHYWMKRHHCSRLAIMCLVSWSAFGLALIGRMEGEPKKHIFTLLAYWVLILDVVLAEFVIQSWRSTRDRGIVVHLRSKEFPKDTTLN
jgi:hypothetical protein